MLTLMIDFHSELFIFLIHHFFYTSKCYIKIFTDNNYVHDGFLNLNKQAHIIRQPVTFEIKRIKDQTYFWSFKPFPIFINEQPITHDEVWVNPTRGRWMDRFEYSKGCSIYNHSVGNYYYKWREQADGVLQSQKNKIHFKSQLIIAIVTGKDILKWLYINTSYMKFKP